MLKEDKDEQLHWRLTQRWRQKELKMGFWKARRAIRDAKTLRSGLRIAETATRSAERLGALLAQKGMFESFQAWALDWRLEGLGALGQTTEMLVKGTVPGGKTIRAGRGDLTIKGRHKIGWTNESWVPFWVGGLLGLRESGEGEWLRDRALERMGAMDFEEQEEKRGWKKASEIAEFCEERKERLKKKMKGLAKEERRAMNVVEGGWWFAQWTAKSVLREKEKIRARGEKERAKALWLKNLEDSANARLSALAVKKMFSGGKAPVACLSMSAVNAGWRSWWATDSMREREPPETSQEPDERENGEFWSEGSGRILGQVAWRVQSSGETGAFAARLVLGSSRSARRWGWGALRSEWFWGQGPMKWSEEESEAKAEREWEKILALAVAEDRRLGQALDASEGAGVKALDETFELDQAISKVLPEANAVSSGKSKRL